MESEFEDRFIEAPWGSLCVVCSGPKDGSPIIMLHGNQDTASTFFPLIKYIPEKFRIYNLELPGCGKSVSKPGTQPIGFYDYLYCLKLAVDQLKLDHFIYIGHSMGAQIGLFFNTMYPGIMTKIIALDSVTYDPIEPNIYPVWFSLTYETFYDPNTYKKMTSGTDLNVKYSYEKALAMVMNNRGLTREAGETVLKRALIPTGDGLYRFCWDQRMKLISLPTLNEKFLIDIVKKINIPYLLVLSTNSIKVRLTKATKLNVFYKFAENPKFRITVVEGNHDVHLNSPDSVANYVVPFLLDQGPSKRTSEKNIRKLEKIRSKL